jgi:hypothetical protein
VAGVPRACGHALSAQTESRVEPGIAGSGAEGRSRRMAKPRGCKTLKEETMRKILKVLLIPAAFAMVAGAGIATTSAPAKADIGLSLNFPFIYTTPPYYYGPPAYYYYGPRCYWDSYYGRVCY